MSVEYHGPFVEEWRVTIDDYRVPYISAIVRKDGGIMLSLDERFGIDATREEAEKWLWFVANAMAVAAGRSCFGENGRPMDPFGTKLMGLTIGPGKPDLKIVPTSSPPP